MGKKAAILFVHGILGSPDNFRDMHPLVPEWADVHTILLDGHGSTPREFGNASMARWKAQVADKVRCLRNEYARIVIVAHSMGTLFAIRAAADKMADSLFLLNVPLKLRPTRRMLTTPLKVHFGRISDDDVHTIAARNVYSLTDDPNVFHYAGWIPRFLELFAEIWRTRKLTHLIDVPTRVFLSEHDEMVSPRSDRYFAGIPTVKTFHLPDSGHYHYDDTDRSTVALEFRAMLEELQ